MTRRPRAAVWHGRGDLRVEPLSLPATPPSEEVRIAVDWCGLCGSDLLEYTDGPVVIPTANGSGGGLAVVLGHEFVGTVSAIGDGVTALAVGDVVAADTLLRCGGCHYCHAGDFNLCPHLGVVGLTVDGGFADLVDVPAYMCYLVDPHLPRDVAALAEPLAVAVRALRQAAATPQVPIAVIGCGSIGLLCLMAARHVGFERIVAVDVVAGRRRAAEKAGATRVVGDVPALAPEAGPWALLDCSGSASVVGDLVRAAPANSRIVLVGVTPGAVELPLKLVVDKELELVGSLSHDARDFRRAIDLLTDDAFDASWLITQRIALDDLPATVARLVDGDGGLQLKVIVTPTERTAWSS